MHFLQFDTIVQLVLIGFAVERMTEIIVESKIFEPIRSAIAKWATIDPTKIDPEKPLARGLVFRTYVSYFIKCGYCMSVWVGAAASIFYPFHLFTVDTTYGFETASKLITFIVNFVTSVLLYHGAANWIHVLFKRLQVGVVDVKDIKIVVEDTRNVS